MAVPHPSSHTFNLVVCARNIVCLSAHTFDSLKHIFVASMCNSYHMAAWSRDIILAPCARDITRLSARTVHALELITVIQCTTLIQWLLGLVA